MWPRVPKVSYLISWSIRLCFRNSHTLIVTTEPGLAGPALLHALQITPLNAPDLTPLSCTQRPGYVLIAENYAIQPVNSHLSIGILLLALGASVRTINSGLIFKGTRLIKSQTSFPLLDFYSVED